MCAASLSVMMVTDTFGKVGGSYLSGASCTVSKSMIERW
jgi:hypothetical protein